MRCLICLVAAVAATTIAHGAQAACPAQPASLDLSTAMAGTACIRSSATTPTEKLELRFTDTLGQPAVVTVLPTPPATVFADESMVPWTVPAHIRGSGTIVGAAINTSGAGVRSVPATFRAVDQPAAPVLLGP